MTSLVLPYRLVVLNCPTVLLERDAPGRQLFKTECLHYPQCNFKPLRGHHWKEFIRLHAAASQATKGFILLLHSSTPNDFNVQKWRRYPLIAFTVNALIDIKAAATQGYSKCAERDIKRHLVSSFLFLSAL